MRTESESESISQVATATRKEHVVDVHALLAFFDESIRIFEAKEVHGC